MGEKPNICQVIFWNIDTKYEQLVQKYKSISNKGNTQIHVFPIF